MDSILLIAESKRFWVAPRSERKSSTWFGGVVRESKNEREDVSDARHGLPQQIHGERNMRALLISVKGRQGAASDIVA